jgi:hypothetical protein
VIEREDGASAQQPEAPLAGGQLPLGIEALLDLLGEQLPRLLGVLVAAFGRTRAPTWDARTSAPSFTASSHSPLRGVVPPRLSRQAEEWIAARTTQTPVGATIHRHALMYEDAI